MKVNTQKMYKISFWGWDQMRWDDIPSDVVESDSLRPMVWKAEKTTIRQLQLKAKAKAKAKAKEQRNRIKWWQTLSASTIQFNLMIILRIFIVWSMVSPSRRVYCRSTHSSVAGWLAGVCLHRPLYAVLCHANDINIRSNEDIQIQYVIHSLQLRFNELNNIHLNSINILSSSCTPDETEFNMDWRLTWTEPPMILKSTGFLFGFRYKWQIMFHSQSQSIQWRGSNRCSSKSNYLQPLMRSARYLSRWHLVGW